MGNEQVKMDKNNEYITFQNIQQSLGLKNHSLFKKYLQEIFIDIASSKTGKSKSNEKYLSRSTFHDYIKLPIFISEKLFNSFLISNRQEGLSEDEFVNGFFKLYMGTFEETAKIIFNLFDFDKDGIIKKEDVKLILSYLPLTNINEENDQTIENTIQFLGFQMKSLEEIDDIVNNTFKKYGDKMKFAQFKETVQNRKSDALLQIIFFLYQKKPFSAKNIESLKIKYEIDDKEYEKIEKEYKKKSKIGSSIKIKVPNKISTLSPAQIFLKKTFNIKPLQISTAEFNETNKSLNLMNSTNSITSIPSLNKSDLIIYEENEKNEYDNQKKSNKEQFDKNMSIVRLDNDTTLADSLKLKSLNIEDYNNKENLKELVDKSKQRNYSPSKYLNKQEKLNNLALMNKSIDYESSIISQS